MDFKGFYIKVLCASVQVPVAALGGLPKRASRAKSPAGMSLQPLGGAGIGTAPVEDPRLRQVAVP